MADGRPECGNESDAAVSVKGRNGCQGEHQCQRKYKCKDFFPADRATGLSMAAFSLLMKPYAVCVPVRPGSAPADAVFLPECRVLSVLYCGDYSGIDEAWLTPGSEVKAQNLTPAAPPHVLSIVAVYTGREIDTRRSYSRLVLPVEE